MGRIAAPFGIKGWVKVQPFSEDPGTLMDFESWRVGRGEQQAHYSVEAVQDHGKALVAKLVASTTGTRRTPCADGNLGGSQWCRRRKKNEFTGQT
jgi:ribosomal 30S subunit maturation factor RimM